MTMNPCEAEVCEIAAGTPTISASALYRLWNLDSRRGRKLLAKLGLKPVITGARIKLYSHDAVGIGLNEMITQTK